MTCTTITLCKGNNTEDIKDFNSALNLRITFVDGWQMRFKQLNSNEETSRYSTVLLNQTIVLMFINKNLRKISRKR